MSSPPPEFVHAPQGGAAGVVKAAVAEAGEGRQVVVYVGAEWCEPCQYFHKAVEAGELDAELAGVRFVEFDSDDDGERLTADGYDGKLIPRFVVPAGDGAASDRRIEGGIKGDGAVEHIMRRLAPMLASG
ncbi:MAG: thioredoxin family protein [Myxococcota bacterium]